MTIFVKKTELAEQSELLTTLSGLNDVDTTGVSDQQGIVYTASTGTWGPATVGTTVDASATAKGAVELATTSETTTGTDTVRAVTPAGVKAVADLKANTADLGDSAALDVGTTTGTVMAGDDARWHPVITPATALTAANGSTVDGTYGAEEAAVIANNVARLAEIEAALIAAGIVAGPA